MNTLLKFEDEAVWRTCPECGIQYAFLRGWDTQLRTNRKSFFCPNGHSRWFPPGKSEVQLIREEMQAKLDEANRLIAWEKSNRLTAERKAKASRSALTKQTKRVNAGVCIHCNRTFKQLASHMKCKHPEAIA